MMKYSILLLFTFFSVNTILAQDCTSILLGEIVDFHDNTPLSGATIAITGKILETISTDAGKFSFRDLCDGVIELEVSHPDCKSQFITITLQGDTYEKIRIEHHLEELDEVKVISDKSNNTKSAQEERLSQEVLQKYSGNSLGDALKNLTGVSSLNTGANIVKPVIQGLNGSRVLILNNGVRMQDMEWGEEHAPNVDINSNQDISVVKGAAALEYGGDAIGGVIIMNPLPIVRTDSLYGKTQVNLFSNGRGGNITSSLTKSYASGLYLKAQGSFKKLGDLEAPDYILSNTGIQEKGITLAIGKRDFLQGWEGYYSFFDSNIGILRASHIGNVDDLIEAINSDQPTVINSFTYSLIQPSQEVSHHLAKVNYYKRFEGLGKWTTQYDFQKNRRFEFDIRRGVNAGKASLDLKLITHSVATKFQFDASQGLKLQLGLMGRFQNNFANPETEVRRLIPDYDKYDFGAFSIANYRISTKIIIDGGIRYDYTNVNAKKFYITSRWEERNYDNEFSELVIENFDTQLLTNPIFNYHNISATAGFQYDLNGNTKVRFNYALSQRAPNPAELFSDGLHHSAARIELGDLRFKSEMSSKLSVSIEKKTTKWGFTIAPYLNAIYDFITLEPVDTETTLRGAFPVWEYRQTDAQLFGIDVSIYNNWMTSLRTDHKFSWVHGTDVSTDTPLINIPATNISNSISYNNSKWNNLIIGLESQYAFKQLRTIPNIFIFSPNEQQEVELDINSSPEAYHILAFDAKLAFAINNKSDLTLGLRVTNLLNTKYRDYLNRQRYFADDLGRNMSVRLIYNY